MNEAVYTVVLERNEDAGYTITAPALKGCVTEAHTIADALANAKEAIECHLEALASLGKRLPRDCKVVRLQANGLSEVLVFKVSVTPDLKAARAGVRVG